MIWAETATDLFDEYVYAFFKIKQECDSLTTTLPDGRVVEITKDKIMRNVAILFLNSLFGKMLARAITESTEIVNNINDFAAFQIINKITDINITQIGRVLLTGEPNDKRYNHSYYKTQSTWCF